MRTWYVTANQIAGDNKNYIKEFPNLLFFQCKSVLEGEDLVLSTISIGASPWNAFSQMLSWVKDILNDAK